MSLTSMTGYGRGRTVDGRNIVVVELSSVNRKQFDARVHLPPALSAAEADVVRRIRERIERGTVNCTVSIAGVGLPQGDLLSVNEEAASHAVRQIRRLAKRLGIDDRPRIGDLLRLPGVITVQRPDDSPDRLMPLLITSLAKALKRLVTMRQTEGRALTRDVQSRLKLLRDGHRSIQKLAPSVTAHYREQLIKRIREAGVDVRPDDERMSREVVMFADRADITEELTRLESHFKQMDQLLASAGASGRTLDFLIQEMSRETNTIGAKANDSRISQWVVLMKTELERLREQIQNVE